MLRFFSIIFFLIHVACCTRQMQAQVINIESKRFYNDTNGWVGKADLHFSIMQNTQQVISMGNNVHLQYQKSNSRFLILNDISFIKAGTTDFVNSGFQHLRYNYKVFDKITLEVFSQAQYNRVLLLDLRYLNGIGPRFKLVKKEKFKLYTACLYMYEYEKISNTPARPATPCRRAAVA